MKLATLGTGVMGAGISRSLLRDGHEVAVWNRTSEKAEALVGDGARLADTPGDAVRGADVVVVAVFDCDAVLAVLQSVASDLGDAIVLQTGTVGVDGARRVSEFAAQRGVRLLDLPVLGSRTQAERGELVVLASGNRALRQAVKPVLDSIGSRTLWVGDRLGAASSLKLAVNAWLASLTVTTAQSLALAAGLGVEPQLFLDAIDGTPSDSPYAHVAGRSMLARDYPVSFALDDLRKDLDLMVDAADAAAVHDEFIRAVRDRFDAAAGLGHGGDDVAAVFEAIADSESR